MVAPKLSEEGVLLCPRCGEENLHQQSLRAFSRPSGEDRAILKTEVGAQDVRVSCRTPAEAPTRRDWVDVDFTCEMCHADARTPTFTLRIYQHKGRTYVEWLL